MHVSVHFTLAKPGDPVVKELILRGKARKYGTKMVGGEVLDIIRHRGTTYRRPEPKAPSKRDTWRNRWQCLS